MSIEYMKKYRDEHKEQTKEYNKKYYEIKRKEHNKYYDDKKDTEIIKCIHCDKQLQKRSLNYHNKNCKIKMFKEKNNIE